MQTNKSGKGKWNFLFIALTAAVMVWLMSQMNEPEEVWRTLRAADARYLAAALGCMVVFWLLESMLLRTTARGFGQKLTRRSSLRVSMIGQLFNNITPFASGGQPVQAYELARCGVSYGESSCILMVKFIVYQLAMTLYALFVTIWKFGFFSARRAGFGAFVALGFLTNIVALSTMVAVGFFPRATHKCLYGLVWLAARLRIARDPDKARQRVDAELDLFYANFQVMRRKPTIVMVPLLLTLLQLTAYFTIPYLIFRSLGIADVDYEHAFCATLFVFMVTSFVPAPGASGGAEGSFFWFLSIFITNKDLLLMTTVLWRILTFYIPIAVGACFYFAGRRRSGAASPKPDA